MNRVGIQKDMIAPLGIIFLLLGLSIALGTSVFSVTSGTTVLSVDAPNIETGDEDLRNLNWLVLTRLGGSDEIQIQLSPEDFDRLGGEATKNSWTATASAVEETLEYNINLREDFKIYDYQVSEILNENDYCGEDVVQEFILTRPFIQDKKFCVSREFVGRYGTLSEPTNKISAELSVSNGRNVIKETITSDAGSVDFKQNGQTIATATWQGNLVTGNANPDVPEIAVIGANTGDTWDFISRTKLNTYQNSQEDFERVVTTQTKTQWSTFTPDGFNELQEQLSSESNNLDSDRSRTVYRAESIDSSFNLINPDSTSNALLRFKPDYTLANPLVTWWIRADYLGISRSSGQPKIVSATSNEFGNDEQGTVLVEVLNAGDSSTFVATLESCGEFKQSTTSNEFFAAGGERTTTALYVDAGSKNTDLSESCEVRVFDRANPSKEDTKSVDLSFSATKVCTAGNYFAQGNTIYECNEDGLGSTAVKNCDDEIKFTGEGSTGGYECAEDDEIVCDGEDCDKQNFNKALFFTALVIGLVLAGLGTNALTAAVPKYWKLRRTILSASFVALLALSMWLVVTIYTGVVAFFSVGGLI